MKHTVIILIVLIASVFSSSVIAQTEEKKDMPKTEAEKGRGKNGNEHIKRFKEFRRDFLTKKVQMTQEEADAFFPLYDELGDKKFKLQAEVGEKMRKVWDENKASDVDYNAVLDALEEIPVKEAALEKEYGQKFRKILSPKKMFRLKMAENEFSRELMRRPDRKDKRDNNNNAPEKDRRLELKQAPEK